MFIVMSFTIAKRWKQPKCLSADEWIHKIWYIQTKEYDSATIRNEVLIYAPGCMNAKNIMLAEINQTQKVTWCMIPSVQNTWTR